MKRAEEGFDYYFVNGFGEIQCFAEEGALTDGKLFNAGNYFKSEQEAKESKFYKVFHEEEL